MRANRVRAASKRIEDFDPVNLSPLVFYDPLDISTLWTDTGGTAQVSSAGDIVRRLDDKSGNGYHATGANGSTYQTDGYLEFDGINDALTVSIPQFTYPYFIIGACGRNSATGASGTVAVANPATQYNSVGIGIEDSTGCRAWVYPSSGFLSSNVSDSSQKLILTGDYKSDGSKLIVNSGDVGGLVTGTIINATSLGIGILNRINKVYYAGEVGGLLVFDYDIGDANRELCEQWLANRYGVTI